MSRRFLVKSASILSLPLHRLDDAGGPVETDLEAPLEHRNRSASRPDHLLDRLVELLVPRRVPLLLFARKNGDGGLVFGRALRPKVGDDALDLPLSDEGAVAPKDPPPAGLGDEHGPEPENGVG